MPSATGRSNRIVSELNWTLRKWFANARRWKMPVPTVEHRVTVNIKHYRVRHKLKLQERSTHHSFIIRQHPLNGPQLPLEKNFSNAHNKNHLVEIIRKDALIARTHWTDK